MRPGGVIETIRGGFFFCISPGWPLTSYSFLVPLSKCPVQLSVFFFFFSWSWSFSWTPPTTVISDSSLSPALAAVTTSGRRDTFWSRIQACLDFTATETCQQRHVPLEGKAKGCERITYHGPQRRAQRLLGG